LSPFVLGPFVLGFFLQILPDATNRQNKCRSQEDNKQKTWAISIFSSPNHGRQYHMGSEGISRLFKRHFGLFRVKSSVKGHS